MVSTRSVTFPAGPANLSGTLFLPTTAPRAALVLNGATGVPQSYYRHFAKWLAQEQDIACLTFDYRDMGASATGHVRDSDATMSDWALIDQPAARAEMRRQLPDVPLWVMGHSLGALLMPMQDGIDDVARMIGVASGLVRHVDHPWPYQAMARLFWFGHAPLLTRILGYLPGQKLGFGKDMPAPAYWEWRDWCTNKYGYFPHFGRGLPFPNWSRSGAPVKLVALADDVMIPPHCVKRLGHVYDVRRVTHQVLNPVDYGLKSIGHIGAFAQRNKAAWADLIA